MAVEAKRNAIFKAVRSAVGLLNDVVAFYLNPAEFVANAAATSTGDQGLDLNVIGKCHRISIQLMPELKLRAVQQRRHDLAISFGWTVSARLWEAGKGSYTSDNRAGLPLRMLRRL